MKDNDDGESGSGWTVDDEDKSRRSRPSVSWDDLALAIGDQLEVRTRNTTYRLTVLDPRRRLVEVVSDGRAIPGPARFTVMGSLLSQRASAIYAGRLVMDLSLELQAVADAPSPLGPPPRVATSGLQAVRLRRSRDWRTRTILPPE